jgi:hypothetical protein
MAKHVFHNTKVIDKSNQMLVPFAASRTLAIQRYKPELNHGLKGF